MEDAMCLRSHTLNLGLGPFPPGSSLHGWFGFPAGPLLGPGSTSHLSFMPSGSVSPPGPPWGPGRCAVPTPPAGASSNCGLLTRAASWSLDTGPGMG